MAYTMTPHLVQKTQQHLVPHPCLVPGVDNIPHEIVLSQDLASAFLRCTSQVHVHVFCNYALNKWIVVMNRRCVDGCHPTPELKWFSPLDFVMHLVLGQQTFFSLR